MVHYYQNHQYQAVLQEAKKSQKEYNNPKLHLLWAKSATYLGQTTTAMGAYERVLILDENNQESIYALKKIYRQTKRRELAPNVDSDVKQSTFKLNANLSYGYDTNINVTPGSAALKNFFGTANGTKLNAISTQFVQFTTGAEYTYKLGEMQNWFIRSTLNVYNQSNIEAHTYDMFMGSAELGVGYFGNAYKIYLPMNYNYIEYLNRHLLNRYRLTPKVTLPFYGENLLEFNALYSMRDFVAEKYANFDATSMGLGAGVYFFIDKSIAHVGIRYETRSANDQTIEKFVDADFIDLDFNLKYEFLPKIWIEGDYHLRLGAYDDNINTFAHPSTKEREDTFQQIGISLLYALNKDIELTFSNTYTDNDSNYIATKFNKNVTMLGINYTY